MQSEADFVEPGFARFTVVRRGADFDEFVRLQIAFDFQDDGGRQSLIADHDDRGQRMRLRFERAALDRG